MSSPNSNGSGNSRNPLDAMGAFFSAQVNRRKLVTTQKQAMAERCTSCGDDFLGCGHRPADRRTWMAELGAERLRVHQVVWPGSHDSATNKIGIPLITRPFAQCQSLSVYEQLAVGCRLVDVRVCHGVLATYSVDVVLDDVKRFLAETESEILVLEIRTEFGRDDPPDFAKYLVEQLGEHLIPRDEAVFHKTVAELLPRRVICVWKPRFVCRNCRGEVVLAACFSLGSCASAEQAESLACSSAILMASQCFTTPIIVETDCSVLGDGLKIDARDRSAIGTLLQEIKLLLSSFSAMEISLVNRACNRVAHELASFSRCGVEDACWRLESPLCVSELLSLDCNSTAILIQ